MSIQQEGGGCSICPRRAVVVCQACHTYLCVVHRLSCCFGGEETVPVEAIEREELDEFKADAS